MGGEHEMPEQTKTSQPPREVRTSDVKCLACGVYNIPENRICGACGASLPLIYDKDGKVFRWETDSPYWEAIHPSKKKGLVTPGASAWILRVSVLLLAILFALWLMYRNR
jgi:hypothetical protein